VTLEDYQNVALAVPSCGKASAMSSVPGSVLVAVAPYRNTGAAEDYPGFEELSPGIWTPAQELVDLQTAVAAEIDLNRLAGTQVTIIDPTYLYMDLAVTVDALPVIRVSDALTIIKQAITERFDYARAAFGATIYLTDVIALISSLGVATTISVDDLNTDGLGGATNLTALDDEILLLREADLTVVVTGGVEGV
jgi:hypothetical protein